MSASAPAASVPFQRPSRLKDALGLLAETETDWQVLAGGTDFYPALRDEAPRGAILDITALDGLTGISESAGGVRIGALTRWSEIARAPLPPAFDALKRAAREVGAVQIQNSGTLGGNLCTASPAGDGIPPLLVLDAAIELRSARGARTLPLGDFITGYRETARAPDELVTAVTVPATACVGQSHFAKLGARRYLVISIAMVAVRLVLSGGHVAEAAIAVGACSPVAQRLPALEAALVGQPADAEIADLIAPDHLATLAPIDDVRGTAGYRADVVREMIARAFRTAVAGGNEGAMLRPDANAGAGAFLAEGAT